MKAMLRSHLDCQGGLSVPETRLELAYASSENPQNTLAKSKARKSICLKSKSILSFSNAIWFSQVSSFVQISQYFLYLSKPLAWGMFHYPHEQSNEMVLSRLPS